MDDSQHWNASVTQILERACLAPSSHNTQPWRFRVFESVIELLADDSRALPVNDPHNRELTISCGCVLETLVLAANEAGMTAQVQPLPDPDRAQLLATVTLSRSGRHLRSLSPLSRCIGRRHTHRGRFNEAAVDPRLFPRLHQAIQGTGVSLTSLNTPGRRALVAALVAEGDRQLWANVDWRRELAAWMRPATEGDGLVVPSPWGRGIGWAVRTFNLGRLLALSSRQQAQSAPLLLALSTDADTPRLWLDTGRALQRLLLAANHHGYQASFLNQAVQVPELRDELSGLLEGSRPQIVLSLGVPASELAPSPRRPLSVG
ncbi:hypothetical protein [Ferrimonas sp. SCSIO 43195]|uniref:Acg family FMN-binding oxidoreductase n=1 Tax=Ferrimonas sp. SCSIO 43195 TaxID=2822844 RepID=UPI0020760D5E|nr:hypothetical protein [Ferrimonas sp. SCSIO 43195]USD35763.1 nitroreductase family protein [Ferrimonas sp. SCSIO 43195]